MRKISCLRVRKIFFVLLILLIPSFIYAQEIAEEKLTLSLKECISLAMKKNLDIRMESLDPLIQEKEITKEKAEFDPRFILEAKDSESEVESTSVLSGGGGRDWYSWLRYFLGYDREKGGILKQESLDFNSKLTEKFITGGVGELKFTNNRFRTNSFYQFNEETYQSYLTLSLTQPLLKNFGTNINRSRIKIASNNRDISKDQFRGKVITIVSQVKEAYWDLWASLQESQVRRYSLELARDLLNQNESLVKAGRLPPVAILQAESGVASRKEGVLLADNAVKKAQDRLRQILNLIDESWEKEPHIFPKDNPDFIEKKIDAAEGYKIALEKRPDFNQAQIALANQKLTLKLAKNQLLPKFDIGGSYTLSGTDPHYGEAVDQLFSGDTNSWEAGAVFEIPLGNRLARSACSQEEIKLKKSEIGIQDLQKKILLEVKDGIRGIETNLERIKVTQEARILAEKKLKAEEEKFQLGRSTTSDILRFQEDLALAKINEDRALVDYRKSLSRWETITAQSLENNNIVIAIH